MNYELNGLITPNSIMFVDLQGVPHTVSNSHVNFEKIKTKFRQIREVLKSGSFNSAVATMIDDLVQLADVSQAINAQGHGQVTVENGTVMYNGSVLHNTITDRILKSMGEGFDMEPYLKFLQNLMQNPSKVAVDELYDFMEYGGMGISNDGYILGYKKVRNNFHDIHSGHFDNSPGQTHSMPRNSVDPDRNRTCSSGFHFCSFGYLPQFGNGMGNRVVLVKVNPRDVVAVPADYANTKARCSSYTVISELPDASLDFLREKSVYTNTDVHQMDFEADEDVPEWAELDEPDVDYEQLSIENFPQMDDTIDLIEYYLDEHGETVRADVHHYLGEDYLSTDDPQMISALFEFLKTRATLTGEKQRVKVNRKI